MIRAIIFDFGRVISAPKPVSLFRDYEEDLGLAPGVLNRIMFGSDAWQEVLVGRKTTDDYWREIGPAIGLRTSDEIGAFRRRYFADEAINVGVLDLIRRLHGRYRLAVLSNSPPGLAQWLAEWEILALFDVVVCSGDEGLVKPDPAIFELTLERLDVAPEEAVFVDDSPGHVEAARALGLHGNLFTTAEALAGELESVLSTQRVMVIMAHPDDAEFTAGGTVARWAQEGKAIVYVICTDGSRGSNDPQVRPQDLVATRRAEQEAAARLLGVEEVVYLGYEDGSLQPTLALRRDLTRVIRRYRPDIVICPDPTVRYYGDSYLNHPDHRAAGDAALDAVSPSANTRYIFSELLAEGLEPHEVRDVYIRGAPEPNVWVDIGDTIELKIAALKKHESQVSHFEGLEDMIRDWAREEAAGQDMTYAESFRRLTLG